VIDALFLKKGPMQKIDLQIYGTLAAFILIPEGPVAPIK
jgi:hypothetical protein